MSYTITLTANSVDITSQVRPGDLLLEENITSKVDTLSFKYRKYGNRTYVPVVGHVVSISIDYGDGAGAIKEFEGTIVQYDEEVEGVDILVYTILVKDYTHLLDQVLIAETYENQNVKAIVDDFIANWLPSGITGNNVSTAASLTTIEFIQFDYSRPSDALRDLGDMIGFDFWIDADKDLHFVPRGTSSAPFNLTDTNQKYTYRSLKIRKHDKQLRNTIYVEGAEYVGSTVTDKVGTADNDQKTFNLPYKYDSIPTVLVGGTTQTVGVLYLNNAADYDCLWSRAEKVITFDTAPVSGDVDVTGDPLIPLFIKLSAPASVASKGAYEFKITDKTLKSQDAVRKRALAEIEAYADSIGEGSFETNTPGLHAGQRITINSTLRGIVNQEYVIQQVTWVMRSPTSFTYTVRLANVKSYQIVEFLRQLLRTGEKTLGVIRDPSSVLNLITSLNDIDIVEMTETFEINNYKADLTAVDGVDLTESLLRAAIDSPPTWVYGPYAPVSDGDRKRPPKIGTGAYYQ